MRQTDKQQIAALLKEHGIKGFKVLFKTKQIHVKHEHDIILVPVIINNTRFNDYGVIYGFL